MNKTYKGIIYNINPYNKEVDHLMRIIKTKGEHPYYFYSIYPYFGFNSDDNVEGLFRKYDDLCNGTASDEVIKRNNNAHISIITCKNKLSGTTILYEKAYDIDGNAYGREILTRRYFPLIPNYADYDVFYQKRQDETIYFDESEAQAYSIGIDFRGTCYLQNIIDSDDRKYIKRSDYKYLINDIKDHYSLFVDDVSRTITVSKETVKQYDIRLVPKLKIPQDQKIEYAITNEQLATEYDLNEYQNVKNKINGRFRQRKLIKEIEMYSSLNHLGLEYYQFYNSKPTKKLIIEGSLLNEIQELEFLLSQLREISIDDYNKFNSEKEELIDGNNKVELNESAIQDLQSKVKAAIICHGSNSTKMIEYLNNEINKCFENYKSNTERQKTISIYDLDNVSEQLLMNKDKYSIKEQNDLLRNIAILYFFNIFDNKDRLTEDDLDNSYVINNIRRIITVISVLKSEGIIENVTSNLFEITNLSELLELIRNITFTSQEKLSNKDTNELVKRIQH